MKRVLCTIGMSFLAASACAMSADLGEAENREIIYIIVDNPSGQKFEISIENRSGQDLCVGYSDWPNSAGLVGQLYPIYVDIGQNTYQQDRYATGTCYQIDEYVCSHRIESGTTLSGAVPYQTFDIPSELYGDHKVFRYHPFYWYSDLECRD